MPTGAAMVRQFMEVARCSLNWIGGLPHRRDPCFVLKTQTNPKAGEVTGTREEPVYFVCQMVMFSNCLLSIYVNIHGLVLLSSLVREAALHSGESLTVYVLSMSTCVCSAVDESSMFTSPLPTLRNSALQKTEQMRRAGKGFLHRDMAIIHMIKETVVTCTRERQSKILHGGGGAPKAPFVGIYQQLMAAGGKSHFSLWVSTGWMPLLQRMTA